MSTGVLFDMQILLVDDTPTNIDVLSQTLRSEGYQQLLAANNGERALKIAAKTNPDLILLDVMMPGIDGFETCRRLKANEDTCGIPIIFCTAKTETKDIVTGFESGGVDYITKPFHPDEVLSRVNAHLQLRHANKLLETRNLELQSLNEAKNKLLGTVAHDLRNPIGAILSSSEILLEDLGENLEEEALYCLNTINKASHMTLSQINDLLDVSAIESGQLSLNLISASLYDVIQNRLTLHHFLAEQKNITLKLALEKTPLSLFDPNRIGQVIDNLLGNAIKFSPQNTTISMNLAYDNAHLHFSIRDQGPGVSEDDKQKLFKDFQQLSAKPTGGEKSTGLGLAIVKKIIDAHHAELFVDNHPEGGAIFGFRLNFA